MEIGKVSLEGRNISIELVLSALNAAVPPYGSVGHPELRAGTGQLGLLSIGPAASAGFTSLPEEGEGALLSRPVSADRRFHIRYYP
ncbi:hypothetical protein BQ8794_180179 [Mesorhizobium prunaredense]|uniref:Uncharacterized protein n=1 Tax=Mesorhizobium prunaredense TaxID=1631249 RepID=A0A1R3V4J5_9HYPH|nr:hypothetical protein BQ8794_180179 [Mesorhizobium prunaredense]